GFAGKLYVCNGVPPLRSKTPAQQIVSRLRVMSARLIINRPMGVLFPALALRCFPNRITSLLGKLVEQVLHLFAKYLDTSIDISPAVRLFLKLFSCFSNESPYSLVEIVVRPHTGFVLLLQCLQSILGRQAVRCLLLLNTFGDGCLAIGRNVFGNVF